MVLKDTEATNETLIRVHQSEEPATMAAHMVRALTIMLDSGMKWYTQDMTGYMSDDGMVHLANYLSRRYGIA